ncbi:hypothetical protein Q757_06275, partial [Oenococcus alcoholitolerans]
MESFQREKQLISILEAVEKYGSISKAADKLYMTQPAISKTIAKYENEYSLKFLDRCQHPIKLTAAGHFFLQRSREIYESYQELTAGLLHFVSSDTAKISIGINQSLAEIILPKILPDFYRMNPSVSIDILEKSSSESEASLLDQEIDLSIGIEPVYNPQLADFKIASESALLVVADGKGKYHQERTFEDISPYIDPKGMIIEDDSSAFQRLVSSYFSRYNIKTRIITKTANITTAFRLAGVGIGSTIIPFSLMTDFLFPVKTA